MPPRNAITSASRPRPATASPVISVICLARSYAGPSGDSKPSTARRNEPPRLGEALDEVKRRLGDLAPAMVDSQGMASVRHLHDLRDAGVALLPFVGGVRDRPRHRVILLPVDDQQGAAVGVL